MALSKGTNAYSTVEEADAYFEDRAGSDAWSEADDDAKSRALITAASVLNGISWIGVAVSSEQTLAFPRSGWYFDPLFGKDVALPSTVPDRVVRAGCELALHLISNEDVLADSGSLSSLSVGSVSLQIKTGASTVPPRVKGIISPLMERGGSRSWWRSN